MNNEMKLILLDEYKRGFSEVEKLVHGFEGISNRSQKVFLETRKSLLTNQLEEIREQRAEIYEEIKRVLAKVNSKLLALSDMEVYIKSELEKCRQTESVIDEEGGEANEEVESICSEGKDQVVGVGYDSEGTGQ